MESTAGVSPAETLRTQPGTARQRDRIFYTSLPVLMALAVVYGFSRSYYFKLSFGTPVLSPLFHLHGALFTSWLVLLVVQTSLVAAGRTPLHRKLGVAGGVLAAAMTMVAILVSRVLGSRAPADPMALGFLTVPLATVVVFPAFVGAALWWRRFPEVHKRLMLLGTIELLPAGFGRWPILSTAGPLGFLGLPDLFIVAMAIYDRARIGRVHPATLWGGLFLIASQVLRVVLGNTAAWQAFARWFVS
jgi:hypothetical protein